MQIQKTNLNFTSRNATIRKADDLARKINNEFPRISKTKFESFSHYNERGFLNFKLREKIRRMRNMKDSGFKNATHSIQKLLAFMVPIKASKCGNCAESAQLAAIGAKMNNIENCTIARLRNKANKSYDHQVLLVNDKKPYVIDPWLGFADYIPNAIDRYKGIYRENFDFEKLGEEGMHFIIDQEDEYDRFLRRNISEEDLKTLISLYPKLLV